MKIALGFWGITRSLKYTIDSFEDKIIRILKENNISYAIFMHTYKVNNHKYNPRSNESSTSMDINEYKLLNPLQIEIDDEDEIKEQLNFNQYRTHRDPRNSNYRNVDNFIWAMYSKQKLCKMIKNSKIDFDYIMILRPDVKYIDNFEISFLQHVNDDTICVPNFHNYSNINGRFFLMNYSNLSLYGDLFYGLLDYSRKYPVHAESFYYYYLSHVCGLNLCYISFRFNRVRCNGYEENDSELFSTIKITYGILNNNIDVTMIALDKCLANNVLFIPKGEDKRVQLFSDPLFGTLKSIFIEKDGIKKEYTHTEEIFINMTNMQCNIKKIAIGFFGITRSLQYTIKSINENILDILKINKIEYDIYVHTYNLTNYTNIRTGEVVNNNNIDNEEYKLLNADYIEIDVQDNIKEKINVLLYRTHPDPWGTNYNSVDNFILAQYSKNKLTKMIKKRENNYDYILFLRPDCLYFNKLPLYFFYLINDYSIIIPNFHLYGNALFNDRFCICNKNTYKIYGEVFNSLLNTSKSQSLHAETIVGGIMNNHNLNIIRIPFNFSRVRFDGTIVDIF